MVIIRGIKLSMGHRVFIMLEISWHNDVVTSLLSEVFLAQFKLNHKQPNVHNNL